MSEMLGRSLLARLLAVSHTQSVCTGNQSGARAASGGFYNAASSLMSRVGGNMSSGTIQNNQRVFGRGTNLTLPNGGKFGTNHITRNSNSHARNNQMGGGTALVNAEGPLPGMKDRLCPDFNNPSTKFQAAACNPNNFASSISGVAESMLTRRPSPADPQLQAVLQESAAYAASTSSTFEDDTQAAMKQSVFGSGAPDILGVYDDNDPDR